MIGLEPFRRLLNHPRTAHAAFIAETPIDAPGDDRRNVEALKKLVAGKRLPSVAKSRRKITA
jgi:deoxyribonuclease-4